MYLTFCLLILCLFAILLMLYSGVALIQNKKLFSSAPNDIQEAIGEHDERFKGAHLIGWILLIISAAIITFSLVYGAWDGIMNNFTLWEFFVRFFIMFEIYKLFDMCFIDWFLLTKSNFYQHYYPETRGCESYDNYGFNLKSQLLKLIVIFPLVAFALAFVVSLI